MKKTMFILALTALLLSSCFIPDNYEVNVFVHKDGSYDFEYKGDLIHIAVLDAISKGTFDKEKEEELQDVMDGLLTLPGFKSVKNLGEGRFKVGVKIKLDAGEDYSYINDDMNIFNFQHQENGDLAIKGFVLEENNAVSLDEFNIKMLGTFRVHVAKGVKVDSHNADEKKKGKKGRSVYTWELNSRSPAVEMVVKK
jgi:hypothetical protein